MAGSGSASAAVFLVLVFFSLLVFSAVGVIAIGWNTVSDLNSGRQEAGRMREILMERIELFHRDESPDWHGPEDTFLTAPIESTDEDGDKSGDESSGGGYQITVRDISSGFNMNWLRKNIITRGGLHRYLIQGKNADELQQYRIDHGFSHNMDHYADYFDPDFLKKYATCYGYWNVNVADEFSLEKIFDIRTDVAGGGDRFRTSLHEEIQSAVMLDAEALKEKITQAGGRFGDLWPVINTEAAINVNFAPEFVLETLLAYEDFGVVDPDRTMAAIRSMRENGDGISPEEIEEIICLKEPDPEDVEAGREPDRRIFEYLGCTTWFWEITVEKPEAEGLRGVVAVIPPAAPDGAYETRLVEITELKQ